MFLAADIGGTKTILALFPGAGARRPVREAIFPSGRSPSFEAMLRDFLGEDRRRVRACAVGVAGPVADGRSQIVNLRWPVDERRIARLLGLARERVRVLNDLEATAWGLRALSASRLVSLTPGLRPRPGNAALIAAGTGLGTAILFWDGERHRPCAAEGGHQGFAPRDDLEAELWRYLRGRFGRVSVERVVSGRGLSHLYEFLVETERAAPGPELRRRLAEAEDPNRALTEAALAGEDPLAVRVLDWFVSLYGAAAGDLALVSGAAGGVYVGGGIAPKILPRLRAGGFVRAFRDKGRLRPYVERIPVRVITEPRAALLGAAACAQELAAPGPRAARRKGNT